MPRCAPDRARLLAAVGIVALHMAALVFIRHNNRLELPVQGPAIYTQLLLRLLPASKPASALPVPGAGPAAASLAHRPAPPVPRAPSAAQSITSAPAIAPVPAPGDEPRAVHAPAHVPADWADAPVPATREKVDVAALVAAAGDNERARRKEALERVRDGQRIRGTMDDSPAARAISKAGRADCTKKYSGGTSLDPLRLIPLLYDTMTDTGCKW